MVNSFINHMRVYFNNSGYHRLPLTDPNIHCFLKQAQNHIYIINLYDINLHPIQHWAPSIMQFEMELYSYFDKFPVHRKFILNLFVGEEPIKLFTELKDTPVNYDSDILSINWFVDIRDKDLIIPDHMPNKILGIEKEILQYLKPSNAGAYRSKKHFTLRKKTNVTLLTYTFIGANLLLWFMFRFIFDSEYVLLHFGLNSRDLFQNYEVWRLFTSMFTHLSISHVAYNMLSLYIFGTRLEKYLGPHSFFMVYMVSGLLAGLFSALMTYFMSDPMGNMTYGIGASGAIFGIMGSSLYLTYKSGQNLEDFNAFMIFLLILAGVLMGFAEKNVDNMAHIGGLLAGFVLTHFVVRQKGQFK